ncbi:MAG: polyhydroxybutyrate depolymerase [Litoreibacter sp.]|nr:polyhydroxybutyrate depolymerase [Litoreibacter sp.]
MIRALGLAAAFAFAPGAGALAGCNGDADPCETPQGSYHAVLPEDHGGRKLPALVFLHGAGGTGKGILRQADPFLERGYAVIGPNGMEREGRFRTGWYFHPVWGEKRDELNFVREVIADAEARFGIDPDQVLLGGFSIGGSTASYLACADPTLARAYAPVAGGFWRPHPEDCAGPVNLLHTHGWRDKTVPLEGRPLRDGFVYQGDIFVTLQIWRAENGCDGMRADSFETDGPFWRRKWETCNDGALEFALHDGAHSIPKGWSSMVMDWFEALD